MSRSGCRLATSAKAVKVLWRLKHPSYHVLTHVAQHCIVGSLMLTANQLTIVTSPAFPSSPSSAP